MTIMYHRACNKMIRLNKRLYIYILLAVAIISFSVFLTNQRSRFSQVEEAARRALRDRFDGIKRTSQYPGEEMRGKTVKSHSTVVILLAHFRTGSTFFGQILNMNPEMFYIFEPLRILNTLRQIGGELPSAENTPVKLLDRILRCQFSEQFASTFLNFPVGVYYTKNLTFILNSGYADSKFDSPASVLRKMCDGYRGNVATKIIRASLDDILSLLDRYPNHDNLKIIHIVRDPRGVANSRKLLTVPDKTKKAFEAHVQSGFEPAKTVRRAMGHLLGSSLLLPKGTNRSTNGMETVNEYCDRLYNDLTIAMNDDAIRNRYKLVRYEDFAAQPQIMTEKIYSFLGVPTPNAVMKWLQANTNVSYSDSRNENSMGLHKNSSETASKWRLYLTNEEVQQVQGVCANVMGLLGYRFFASGKALVDFTVPSTAFNTLGSGLSITYD